MKSFLKLASVVVFAGGVVLSAEGMIPGENRGRHDGVTNDETAGAFISANGTVTINHNNVDNNGMHRVNAVMTPNNPRLTINNLALMTVPLTFGENSKRSPSEQLTGAQLRTECVNALIAQFNRVQQNFINILGPNNVTVLEGTDLRSAASSAVDRVLSYRQGRMQAQQRQAVVNSYEDNRRRRIQNRRDNKKKH